MTSAERPGLNERQQREQRIAELNAKWLDLIETEEEAFQRCCELDREFPEKTSEKSKAVRHWWNVVNSALWMFILCPASMVMPLRHPC